MCDCRCHCDCDKVIHKTPPDYSTAIMIAILLLAPFSFFIFVLLFAAVAETQRFFSSFF